MERKMKKPCRVYLLILYMVLIMTACADSGEKISTENTSAANTTENGMGLDLSAMEYNPKTDAQPDFINSRVAKSESGYYFWDTAHMGFMMYYDISSGKKVPLCNRPDCSHDDTDCNAYYHGILDLVEGDRFDKDCVYFCNGSLYVIGCDRKDYVNLYRIAEDGSSRELDTRLFKADYSASDESASKDYQEWIAPEVCVHRGYAYYIDPREKQPVLRRVKLGGSEPEVLYETEEGEQPDIYRLKAYGDYLFFQTMDTSIENSLLDEGLCVYNTRTGEVRMVKKDIIAPYTIADGVLYYYLDGGIWNCSLKTAEEKLLVKDASSMDFSTDGRYLYIFDEGTGILEVYDNKGEFVSRIEDKHLVRGYCGCDSQYMFAMGTTGEIHHGSGSVESQGFAGEGKFADLLAQLKQMMAVMDLSELQKGNGKWTYLFDFDYLSAE